MRLNRRVSIWKHVRVGDGKWRYCRPVLDAKGKMVADMVTVKGHEERHTEGGYCHFLLQPEPDLAKMRTQASGRCSGGGAPADALQGYGTRYCRATREGADHGDDRRGSH